MAPADGLAFPALASAELTNPPKMKSPHTHIVSPSTCPILCQRRFAQPSCPHIAHEAYAALPTPNFMPSQASQLHHRDRPGAPPRCYHPTMCHYQHKCRCRSAALWHTASATYMPHSTNATRRHQHEFMQIWTMLRQQNKYDEGTSYCGPF